MFPETPLHAIHNVCLQTLLEKQTEKPELRFMLRAKETGPASLAEGYWLPGSKRCVSLYFWVDHNNSPSTAIELRVTDKKVTELRLNGKTDSALLAFFRKVLKLMPGYTQVGAKNVWVKAYDGSFYRRSIERFLDKEKPLLDRLVEDENLPHLRPISAELFEEQLQTVQNARNEYLKVKEAATA